MLITFASNFNADITMFQDVAATLLKAMGQSEKPPGILRGENIAQALAKLKKYLQVVEANSVSGSDPDNTGASEQDESEADEEKQSRVSLRLRALPLLEMLETAYREDVDVIWR
jgi:hypothetical protein